MSMSEAELENMAVGQAFGHFCFYLDMAGVEKYGEYARRHFQVECLQMMEASTSIPSFVEKLHLAEERHPLATELLNTIARYRILCREQLQREDLQKHLERQTAAEQEALSSGNGPGREEVEERREVGDGDAEGPGKLVEEERVAGSASECDSES